MSSYDVYLYIYKRKRVYSSKTVFIYLLAINRMFHKTLSITIAPKIMEIEFFLQSQELHINIFLLNLNNKQN